MGFNGGGAGALPAHQHTNVANTGGPLDLNGVTIGSLNQGSVVYSDGAALQELIKPAVPANEVLTYAPAAVAPTWASAGGGVWTEVINEYDNTAANTLDTGFVDMGEYRVLKLFWSAYLQTGTAALDIRFYDPDGAVATAATQGTSGFFNNTFYGNGNQSSIQLSFGQALANGRDIQLEMTILCSSVNRQGTGGSYSMTQRTSYDPSYCNGNFYIVDGFTSTDKMFVNGFQDISGNTWNDAILTVLASGDNTT